MTLGIGLPWQWAESDPGYYARALALLSPPSWYTWKADCLGQPGFTPMVWQPKLGPHFTKAIEAAQHGPRTTWLLGNEPERQEQANVSPADFVAAIQVWLALVGGQWAGPGILWGDEGRWWLYEYIKLGGPIPDYWAIHIYGSRDSRGWFDQYHHARRFFAELRVHRPVWVTETNGGEQLMRDLAASDITAYWYSAHDPFGDNRAADLTNADATSLTELGRLYVSLQGATGAGNEQPRLYMPMVRG